MKSALEQSVKEKIKVLAKERDTTFTELWRNLILERFLTRLAHSPYKDKFVLKGGTMLAKYIYIGRETQDLDFFVQKLSNVEHSLRNAIRSICEIDVHDSFSFEVTKIKILDHSQLAYTGAEITLLATFGATKTAMRMDLGFGDQVEPIEYSIGLTATSKGPLFQNTILLQCYPKEFIFAEKLETVVFRGSGNTRMKDFHDLYSLVHLDVLNALLARQAIQLVFHHRKTPISTLPISFDKEAFKLLEQGWSAYRRKINSTKALFPLPDSVEDILGVVNYWLRECLQ